MSLCVIMANILWGRVLGTVVLKSMRETGGFTLQTTIFFVILFLIDLCFLIIKEDILLYMLICFLSRFSNCFIVRLQPQVEI